MSVNKMQYKVVVKGAYGESNFGDDTLMIVLFNYLKEIFEVKDIAFVCKKASYLELMLPDVNFYSKKEEKDLRSDIFIYGGGTQFFSFGDQRSFIRKKLSELRLLLHLYRHKSRYINSYALGIGIGPFLVKNSEKYARKVFQSLSFTAVRDIESSKLLKKWDIQRFDLFTDICFSMQDKLFECSDDNEITNVKKMSKIGIIVRDWNHTEEGAAYYNNLIELANILKYDYEITLILFSEHKDSYWETQTDKFENILQWTPKSMNIDLFLKKLSKFDMFITARFHGAVFASLLGKPFIAIEVEQKLSLIAKKFDMPIWSYPFKVAICRDFVDYINSNYASTENKILCTVDKEKDISKKMMMKYINEFKKGMNNG